MEDIVRFKDFFESKDQEPLSDDIETIEVDGIEKLEGEWEIESVIDVIVDAPESDTNEAVMGTHVDLGDKEIKRGQVLHITAMIKKPGSSFYAQSRMAVIKLRVMDIFYGLTYLNKIMKNK